MDRNKAKLIVPTLRPDTNLEALASTLSPEALTLLSAIDDRRSINELVELTGQPIKDLLIQIKTLAQQGHIALKKQAPSTSESATLQQERPPMQAAARKPMSSQPSSPPIQRAPSSPGPRLPRTPAATTPTDAKGPRLPKLPKLPKGHTGQSSSPFASTPPQSGGLVALVALDDDVAAPHPSLNNPHLSKRPDGRRTTTVPKPEVLQTLQPGPTTPPPRTPSHIPHRSPPPSSHLSPPAPAPTRQTPPATPGRATPAPPSNAFAQVSQSLQQALADAGGVSAITPSSTTPPPPRTEELGPVDGHLYEMHEEAQSVQTRIEARIAGRPSAQPLSEQGQKVHEIIKGLARVTVTFQLYDPSNDAVRDALGNLYDRLMDALKGRDALFLPITAFAFYCNEEMVYFNDDRENSLAFKLFRDGIRAIQFKSGLNWEELGELLRILGMRYNGVHLFEDDIVTLFWKSNLKYIEVIAVEGFEQDRDQEEGQNPFASLIERFAKSKPKEAKKAMPTKEQNEKVSRFFKGMQGALLSPAIREENGVLLAQQLTSGPIVFADLTPRQLQALHYENEATHIAIHVHSLMQYVERHAHDLIRATELKGLHHLLEQYHGYLITEGNTPAILQLYQELERWDELPGGHSSLLGGISHTLVHMLQKPAVLDRLLKHLDLSESPDQLPPALQQVLIWKQRDLSETLFQLLEDHEKPADIRALIRRMLVFVIGDNPRPYVDRLGLLTIDYTIQMIRSLHLLGTPKAIEVLASQISHYDPKVRGVIFELAEEVFQGAEWVSALRDAVTHMLNSKEATEREKGYDLIEIHGERLWAPILFKHLESSELSLDELKRVACLAAHLHPKGAQSQMIKLAEPPRLLSLESSRRKLQRYAAIAALGDIGTPEAEEALVHLLGKGKNEYKDACVESLRHLKRGGGYQPRRKPALTQTPEVTAPPEGESTMFGQEVDVRQLQNQMMRSLKHVDNDAGNEFNSTIRELGQQFVQIFHMLQKTAILYDAENLIFRRPLREISLVVERLIDLLMGINLVAVEEQFYVNDVRVRLQGESAFQIGSELFAEFQRLQLGGFNINIPLTEQEWRTFVHILAGTSVGKATHWKQLRQQLNEAGLEHHIDLFGPVIYRIDQEDINTIKALPEVYSRGVEAAEILWTSAVRGQAPSPLPMRRVINNMVDILFGKGEQVYELLALEDPDEPLKVHLLHVAIHAMRIGKALGLSRVQLADLGLTAYFHDIGHVALTSIDERRQSQWNSLSHQQAGFALLLKYRGFHEAKIKRLLCTLEHHEDATPRRASQRPILYSRIVRVADVYETITSNMMGDMPISPARAITLLAGETKAKFDPVITQAFVNLMGRYPFGSLLEMEDESLCISLGPDGSAQEFTRPRVLLARTPEGDEVLGPIIKLSSPQHQKLEVGRVHERHDAIDAKRHLVKYLMRRTDVRTMMA